MNESQFSRYGAVSKAISFDNLGVCGRVFFAVNPLAEHVRSWQDTTTQSVRNPANWYSDVKNEFPVDKDGVVRFHSTIQAAVDATQTYIKNLDTGADLYNGARGDVILVGPGKWKENVLIYGHIGLKIFGPSGRDGLGNYMAQMRSSDATTLYPIGALGLGGATGATFTNLSKGVEIAGFLLDADGGHAGMYIGGGLYSTSCGYTTETAHGCYIHHNHFRSGNYGIVLDGAKMGTRISDNIFYNQTYAGIAMWPGNASNENTIIKDNDFAMGDAAYGIWIYGDANSCLTTLIRSNSFRDGYGKVATAGIKNSNATGGGVVGVVGNYFACDNPMILSTGDWVSGNTYGFAGSATVASNSFISEAAAGAEA